MKNKILCVLIVIVLIVSMSSCRKQQEEPTPTPIPPAKSTPTPTATSEAKGESENKPVFADITDFESGNNAYNYGFANYAADKEETYEFTTQITDIPDLESKGLLLSGNNKSDGLIMYLTKDIVALTDTEYTVTLDFDIAINKKSAISEENTSLKAIYVKAGVTNISFAPELDNKNYYRSNWDIGELGNSGTDARALGTAEKVNSDDETYQYKHFSQSFSVITDEKGLICVLIAVDSNVSSVSSVYFDNIVIEIAEQ